MSGSGQKGGGRTQGSPKRRRGRAPKLYAEMMFGATPVVVKVGRVDGGIGWLCWISGWERWHARSLLEYWMGALARTMVVGVLDGGVGTHGSKFFPRGSPCRGHRSRCTFCTTPTSLCSRACSAASTQCRRDVCRDGIRGTTTGDPQQRRRPRWDGVVGCRCAVQSLVGEGTRKVTDGDDRKEGADEEKQTEGGWGLLAAEVARDCQCFNHFFGTLEHHARAGEAPE